MYVRNVLTAGMYVMPVPVGIPMSLQYSEKGNLEKILVGLGDEVSDVSYLLDTLYSSGLVPVHIAISGGTTWVKGVMYTSVRFSESGNLPEAVQESLLQLFVSDPSKFNFFAGNIHSLATAFKGAAPIRNWLGMNKFNVLPGWIASANMSREQFISMVKRPDNTLPYQLTVGYIVYDKDGYQYISTCECQKSCESVNQFLDDNGSIMGEVIFDDGTSSIFHWADIVAYNVQPKTVVVLDKYNKLVYSRQLDDKFPVWTSRVVCPACGNVYSLPATGEATCTDPACPSLQFNRTNRFLRSLKLLELSRAGYDDITHGKPLFSILDIFDSDMYHDRVVDISLSELIFAFIPIEARVDRVTIDKLCSKHNNSVEALCYAFMHPETILASGTSSGLQRLVQWLSNPVNRDELVAILHCNNIKIVAPQAKFDGPPIFRDKRICLTGKFVHGSDSEIIAILRSYSAEVVDEITDRCHLLLVGGTKEDIQTKYIKAAQMLGIPVMDEEAFFAQYDIDADIAMNTL